MTADARRARLRDARLYLCVGIREDLAVFLDEVLGAGVDIVQLRDKHADAAAQLRAAEVFRAACDRHGALFIVNDRADLAVVAGADGVHVGQDDLPPEHARSLVGPELLVGRSTHTASEVRVASVEPVDYIGVGPVRATPTKPGRPGVGLELVRVAAAESTYPFFVTGGMDAESLPEVLAAGARGVVVVRAITEAVDPAAAVRGLRAVLGAR
ncbi:MAG: thiamine phosphate synthase [Actinomycetota bacterium]